MYRQVEPHTAETATIVGVEIAALEAAVLVDSGQTHESTGIWEKAGVAVALSGLAIVSKWAEYKGYDREMIAPERWATDSMAHPLFGYAGAWAAVALSRRRQSFEGARGRVALAGATTANFAVEGVQSVAVAASQYAKFWTPNNLPETFRDYVAALAGLGAYMGISKWQERRRG